MKKTTIYQTLENRGNKIEVQKNGPFICKRKNAWLGNGYYFWDSFIENAHWWGEIAYKSNYYICEANCILEDVTCFDLYGNIEHIKQFNQIKEIINKQNLTSNNITVARIIETIKKQTNFRFDAIRIAGNKSKAYNSKYSNITLFNVIKGNAFFDSIPCIQICFIKKNSLKMSDFSLIYPSEYHKEYGI